MGGEHDHFVGSDIREVDKHFPEAEQVYRCCCEKFKRKDVARDDIVDALVAAITAKNRFWRKCPELKTLQILPSDPPEDSCGLRMEMLYTDWSTVAVRAPEIG